MSRRGQALLASSIVLSCVFFPFSLVSLLPPVYFILYNFAFIEFFYCLLFIFLFFFMILVMLFVCSILLHGFFAVYVWFFLFFFICIFQYWVCVYGLRPLRLCVLLIQWSFFSLLKKKKKCSRIQEYGIFACTKISAMTVVSPHTYLVKETINLVFSQFVFSVFSMSNVLMSSGMRVLNGKSVIMRVSAVLKILYFY